MHPRKSLALFDRLRPDVVVQPIARTRHTIILLLILAVLSAASSGANKPGAKPNHAILYVSVMVGELLLLRYVVIGLRGITLRELIGRAKWIDIIIAAAFWLAARYALLLLRRALGAADDRTSKLMPNGVAESILWILLSITAGLVEEVVFRGYLQRQFAAWLHSNAAAVVVQALIFGVAHGYQGVKSMIVVAAYGVLFGLVAWWRKSLVPGILTHAWTDIFSGLSG